MKSFAIAVLLSAAFPALGQDVKSDAAKDGRDLAQKGTPAVAMPPFKPSRPSTIQPEESYVFIF